MKRFEELNEYQQQRAIEHAMQNFIDNAATGLLEIQGRLGRKIKEVVREAEKAPTLQEKYQFIHKMLGDDLRPYAEAAAETALYAEQEEYVIYDIA